MPDEAAFQPIGHIVTRNPGDEMSPYHRRGRGQARPAGCLDNRLHIVPGCIPSVIDAVHHGLRRGAWFASGMLLAAVLVAPSSAAENARTIALQDVTDSAGIAFRHDNGGLGDWQYTEIVGGGCGILDFDNDGRQDLVFVQSGALPVQPADANPPERSASGGSRLFRNVTPRGDSLVRFEDVTENAGFKAMGYGMGLATGDFTGNGYSDLYITNYGPNTLWRNNGDETFTDVTERAGVGDPSWSTSAGAVDVDRDGNLDLYVVNYVEYDPRVNPKCYAASTRRDYCGPAVFEPAADTLYLGNGRGGFEDASTLLAGSDPLRGLGVVAADLSGDRRQDIYVANDGDPNLFWRNQGNGRLRDVAWPSGTAVNRDGRMEAGMGVDAADLDGDGALDLVVTHLTGESNTYYRNLGGGLFEDDTGTMSLAAASLPYTGFGIGTADFDLDGWLDLFVVNGAVRVIESQREAGVQYPLREPDQIFRNNGGNGFEDVTARLSDALGPPAVGRGAAFGDLNNDGLMDALVCNSHDRPRLYLNRSAGEHRWLGVRATTGDPARDALGATTAIVDNGNPRLLRRVATDGGYLSAHDPRVVFGLGDDRREHHDVLVDWPDGQRERFTDIPANRYSTLHQGGGTVWKDTE